MTSSVDKLDMSFKYILGRLGFDETLPWYEENVRTPELIAHESLMTEKVPSNVPSLMQGGKVNISLNNRGFDSNGKETKNKPVVTARIRVPLTSVNKYGNEEGYYVFSNEPLKLSCKNFGYVVEVLKEENTIEVTDNNFHVINNHVCFIDSKWSDEETLFVSFYEYTGIRGVVQVTSSASSVQEPTDPNPRTDQCNSDEIAEGIINLFYTESRFANSFRNMTTDDLTKGEITQEYDLSVSRSIENLFESIPQYLHQLLISEKSQHFNYTTFNEFFEKVLSTVSSDDLSQGSINKYLSEKSLLDIINNSELIETKLVKESPESLYFTNARAKKVFDEAILSLDVKDVKNAVNRDEHKTLELSVHAFTNNLQSLTTDNIKEGSNLYYNDDRVITNPGFISVSNLLNNITYEYLISPLPHEALPVTKSSLSPLLENWLSEKTLQDIADGDTRRLISEEEMKDGWVMLENKIPVSTDDIKEGEKNKFFSENLVKNILINSSVDLLLQGDGSFTSEKAAFEAQKLINDINLDNVKDGTIYKKLSVGDVFEIVDNRLHPLTEKDKHFSDHFVTIDSDLAFKDSRLNNYEQRLTNVEVELPSVSESLVSVQSVLNAINSDSIPEGVNLYFTDERAYSAISNVLTTSEVLESDSHLYFNSERCLSVCKTNFVSSNELSISESNAQKKLLDKIHPLSLEISTTNTEVDNLKESFYQHKETSNRTLTELFTLVSVSSTILDSHMLSVSINHKESTSKHEKSSIILLSLADEITTSNTTVNDSLLAINTTTTSLQNSITVATTMCTSLESWKEDTEVWKNTLKINASDVIESENRWFFSEERLLSVNKILYDRVETIENNFTTLQTSSATLSDDRLKSHENPITNGLSVVNALAPLSYKMVSSLGAPESEAFDDVGFIAQDVAQIEDLSHAVVQGSDTIPFSLDYHSITTFTVSALQELTLSVSTINNKTTDDIQEGSSNKFLNSENLKVALGTVTTDDLSPGVINKYRDEFVGMNLKLEELKLLLQQIDTDIIPQGSVNLYDQVAKIITTDDVPEANALYFTNERCESIVNSLLSTSLHVDNISETDSKGFLTLARLLHELKFVTADHIGNGLSHKFLSLETFLDLGIDTDHIPEGNSRLYLTEGRVRETAKGMSIDDFIDGNTNFFCSREAVNLRLNSLDTNSLPEAPGKKYVSRDAYFELSISVGDILNNETLARREEVEQSLSLTSLFHTEQLETAISISDLKLSIAENELNTKTNSVEAVFTNSLSISQDLLTLNINETRSELSTSNVKIDSNTFNINAIYSLVSVSELNIVDNRQLIDLNTQSINTNLNEIQINNTRISQLDETLSRDILSVSEVFNTDILSVSRVINTDILSVSRVINTDILSVSEVIDGGILSLSNEIFLVNNTVNVLTTDNVPETNTHKYVSARSMIEMGISTDSISQGESNKYTTIQSVKDVLANLTSSDLPEGELHPYVTKNNVIATQLKPNELNGFPQSINDHLNSISSDMLPEGNTNLYFTDQKVQQILQVTTTNDIQEGEDNKYFSDERVRHALSTASTDHISEGQNKYFTNDRVAAVISASSSSDIKEGVNLYFTTDRVIQTLSIATTDSVPEGISNKYLTKNNVLSIGFDVSEFNDFSNLLLTQESFLSQVSAHLTTDEIIEGNKKFVSSDSVLEVINEFSTNQLTEGSTNLYFTENRVNQILDDSFGQRFDSNLQTKTTDNIPEGSTNVYFTETALAQTLNSSHVIGTGITPQDIGARPFSLSISSSEIVEDQSALFFTPGRFDTQFQNKTTNDLQEGDKQYFTSERAIQSLQTLGTLYVSLTSDSPGRLDVQISVSNDQVLGGKIELQIADTVHKEFEFNGHTISDVITNLNPGQLIVTTRLKSRYGSQTNNQSIIISGDTPYIDDISFIEIEPGFSNQIRVIVGGHGSCELSISSNNYAIKNTTFNLFETNETIINLNCIFDSAAFVLKQNDAIVDSVSKNMTLGLILPMQNHFNVTTNSQFSALDFSPFTGINITIHDDLRILDGNLFHSKSNPLGAILSATENTISYGISRGSLKTQLTSPAVFLSFT